MEEESGGLTGTAGENDSRGGGDFERREAGSSTGKAGSATAGEGEKERVDAVSQYMMQSSHLIW